MRLIDADALRKKMYHEAFETDSDMQKWESGCWVRFKMFENALDASPTIDAIQVVRCKDCKYSDTEELKISSQQGHLENRHIRFCKYELPTLVVADIHFCSCGERKDDE